MKQSLLALILTGLFMALILYSSTLPTPAVGGVNQSVVDHVLDYAHFPVYGILTFLLLCSLCSFRVRFQVVAVIIASLFGVLNEVVQSVVPGRSCSIHDVFVNILGSLFALIVVNYFRKKGVLGGSSGI